MNIKSIIEKLKEYSQLPPSTTLMVGMKLVLLNMARYLEKGKDKPGS